MDLIVCSVRDRATDSFGAPMFVAALGQAVRGFSDEVNSKREGNMVAMHPEDFDLYVLGSFNTDTGLFNCSTPRQVAVGKDCVVAG